MSCDRFEREGLAALERGEKLDPHFASCPDCRAAREGFERLQSSLAALESGAEPAPGWQARVRQRIEERRERRAARWWWLAVPAAAALLAAILLVRPPSTPEKRLALTVEVIADEVVRRGAEAHVGDRLAIQARTGEAKYVELRIYLNDRGPLLTCSTAAPCRRQGDTLEASFVLPSVGNYQTLLFASPSPLPQGSTGQLDRDAGRALAAGAEVELARGIAVR